MNDAPGRPRLRYEEIAEHIELMVLSGETPTGTKLASERELMERFGVGRSTVREALFALRKRGLLASGGGARARVTSPDPQLLLGELGPIVRHMLARPDGVRHFQHARAVLEVALAREAALRGSEEGLAGITTTLEANRKAINDVAVFTQTDLDFHLAVARACANPLFTALHNAMLDWLADQRHVSRSAGALAQVVYLEHKRVHDAIINRDGPGAMAAMEDHLANVVRNYWRAQAPAFAFEREDNSSRDKPGR
jgi:GntR family transcriptional regulator, sialic acid-inducible nan operon repressor